MSELEETISKANNGQLSNQEKIEALDELFLTLFEPSNQKIVYEKTIDSIKSYLIKIRDNQASLLESPESLELLDKLFLMIATFSNNAELRALLVRKNEMVPIITAFIFLNSSDIREKVCSTLAPLVAGLPDAAEDAIKLGILPTIIDLVSAPQDNDKITALKMISFLCSNEPTCATKLMFHGGIPCILNSLGSQNQHVQDMALSAISKLVCSPTVRALISEILPQHKKEVEVLVNLCYSPKIDVFIYAFHSTCMLLMNPSNHSVLRSCNALKAVSHVFTCDISKKWVTHIVARHWLRSHYCLINSPYWQVRGYLAFVFARFCGKHKETVNVLHPETEQIISREAIPIIRILALDQKESIRSLAKIALEHFQDQDILDICDVHGWVNTLDLSNSEDLIASLKKENITMSSLLSREITMDDVKKSLSQVNGIPVGNYLRMIDSLSRIKQNVESDYQDSDQLAKEASSLNGPLEEQRSNERREENPRDSNEHKEEKPDVFISYSWGNKASAQRLRRILERQGLTVWMDELKIRAGEQLFSEIDDGVSNSQVFLACLSPDYSRSVNCRRELLLATERKKIVIPLQVESLEEWPPRGDLGPLLAGKVYINLSSEDKLEELQEQLISAIKQSLK